MSDIQKQIESIEQQITKERAPKYTIICPHCGAINAKNLKVCHQCRKSFEIDISDIKNCPYCGQSMKAKQQICDVCGCCCSCDEE